MGKILSSWSIDNLGVYKYLLYGPLVTKVVQSRVWDDEVNGSIHPIDLCCFHVLLLSAIRCYIYTLGTSFGNLLFVSRNRRIIKDGVDYNQIDKEWDWDNFIILQALVGLLGFYFLPLTEGNLPIWNLMGFFCVFLLHIFISEPLFYWAHRSFHTEYLYKNYHSLHHSVKVPQSFTAGFGTPLEHLMMCVVMGIPLIGAFLMGFGSLSLIYGYILGFDVVRAIMNSNLEVVPVCLFKSFPLLRNFISTPTYHTLHHNDRTTNFCLFMPIFDVLGNTLHKDSWQLHQKNRCAAKNAEVPDFVFLAHVVDVLTALHSPFVFRTCNSIPFSTRLFMLPLWPLAFMAMLVMWVYSKPFLFTFYNLRNRLHQTWAIPRFGFQYFLPFAKDGINDLIELAILRADKIGVKVISLAALNKNEALNGGGTLFVRKHPDLRVRVVHGNTLTAAVIINEIPKDVGEVFLTGATSKLGRAIALYLCRKKIRVLMLTLSTERFQKIQKEAAPEFQQYLVQVTKYQAAQNCKTWIVGKWLTPMEQKWAPSGTHFHQFVVPPIFGFRKDCTYGKLAAMRLPPDVQGLGSCEFTLDRGVVHACHAGGVVHFLEGWTHHEVGAIDVDRIDVVWEAATRHGFQHV